MRNIIPRHKGSDPVKLVWLITILSFCVGVFMVSIVWKTLTDIRIDGEKLFRLKENFTSVRALHEKHLVQEKLDLSSLLDGNVEAGAFPKTSQIFRLVEEYRKVAGTPKTSAVFNQLEESLLTLANMRGKFTRWALDYNRLKEQLPISQKEVESILDQIEETVEKEEENNGTIDQQGSANSNNKKLTTLNSLLPRLSVTSTRQLTYPSLEEILRIWHY